MKITADEVPLPTICIKIQLTIEEYQKLALALYETRWGECNSASRNFICNEFGNQIDTVIPNEWRKIAWDYTLKQLKLD